MSSDEYSYYYHTASTGNYPHNSSHTWNSYNVNSQYMQNYSKTAEQNYNRTAEQNYSRTAEQNYSRTSAAYHSNNVTHNNHNYNSHGSSHTLRSQGYYNTQNLPNRLYYRNRYPNPLNQYPGHILHGWQRNQNNYKRNRLDSAESEPQVKTSKKKKKPLSQNMPKRDWTLADAERALNTEKEHNKKSKFALIIKFPDRDLSKDIVAKFHSSIENVHFQQPCTPRFCFVTLQETSDPEEVISMLNKQKFGEGYLTAEYKKDREEDQTITPEDIDPFTLYVGNLAQEVTKEDMLTMYPTQKRIDIGFAKKMKFTRYAFVGFKTINDAIQAFKDTHNKQLHNKSLIVRFRRLHGTVGMPGESKIQNPPKNKDDGRDRAGQALDIGGSRNENGRTSELTGKDSADISGSVQSSLCSPVSSLAEKGLDTRLTDVDTLNLNRVKQEQPSPNDSDDESISKSIFTEFRSPFLDPDGYMLRPKVKSEVKSEFRNERANTSRIATVVRGIKTEDSFGSVNVKNEPDMLNDDLEWNSVDFENEEESEEEEDDISSNTMDFDSMFETMVNHANKINTLRKVGP